MKKPKNRIFEYTPRFYKPELDEKERKKRKLGFSSQRNKLRRKRSPVAWLVVILIIVFLYLKFARFI